MRAVAASRGRTSKARGNAPNALTLAFRLHAVLRPEAPKGRSTAAQANGLGSKSGPLSFGASPEGAKHEFVAPFQGWVCKDRRGHSATQAAGLGCGRSPRWGSKGRGPPAILIGGSASFPWPSSSPCRILSRCRNSAPYHLVRGSARHHLVPGSGVLFFMICVSLSLRAGPGGGAAGSADSPDQIGAVRATCFSAPLSP